MCSVGPATSVKVTNTASLYKLWIPFFDAFNIWRRSSLLISEFPLHWDPWFCFVIPQNTLGFLHHWRHFDTSRLCNCNITINTRNKILETNLSNGKKKYFLIPRIFRVINVCNQGKNLCSPCISFLHSFIPLLISHNSRMENMKIFTELFQFCSLLTFLCPAIL